jgi:hypothetical protein
MPKDIKAEEKNKLPIDIIKRDLRKTIVYAFFVLALILMFYFFKIDSDTFVKLFKALPLHL